MRSSTRNVSPCSMSSYKENDGSILKRTRRRLQERFENQNVYQAAERRNPEKSWNSFVLPTVAVPRIHPARVLRSGANTLSKTLNSVQTTFGTLSQKFRRSTKRRQQLKNEPCSPITPQSKSRHLLGRTPTKLYSPFGIETPCRRMRGKENGGDQMRMKERKAVPKKLLESSKSNCKTTQVILNEAVVSEKKIFDPDMEEIRVGMWELRQTAHRIVKHSTLQH